ncbi:esterase [Arthrobacter phage Hestia]|uniref:Esterase n=1 Tax=Arthrobacter phage Hestia TaxID=2419609 RepID=A0A3G3M3C9_9CAUD|nr:esterase [Arthrobacter phage Hestia]AYR00912.1 esterase [Arthrobacter phage Hestia]
MTALGLAAAGVAGFAILKPTDAAPVSEQVATYKPPAPTQATIVKVAVFGDSYASGVGASSKTLGWVPRLGRNQSWWLENLGTGGTGYTTGVTDDVAKAKNACGLDTCPSYIEKIPEAKKFAPSIVIVTGGRNDSWVDPEAEAQTINAFYTELRRELPKAKIIAFSPLWDDDAPPAVIPQIAAAVKSSVASVKGTYLDSGQPLQGKPELLADDSKHPNDAGHQELFEKNLSLLQSAGIAAK